MTRNAMIVNDAILYEYRQFDGTPCTKADYDTAMAEYHNDMAEYYSDEDADV
jgi:hypothetical protein